MAENDSNPISTYSDISTVQLKIAEECTTDGTISSDQKTNYMNSQNSAKGDDSETNELAEIEGDQTSNVRRESDDQDNGYDGKEENPSLDDGTVIHAIEPHPGLLLLNLPNPSQSPSPSNATQVLVLNNVDKGTLEANVIFDTQRLRLQNLAQASLISATQESIAKVYGTQGQNALSTSSPYTIQKTASGERIYICNHEGCGRMFKTSGHLKYHRETHGGQKMLKCEVDGCDRRFSWPAHLKYHMKTHLGDRKHKCEYEGCDKSFYVYQRLKVHMRTHTGEKPFKCSEEGCNKSFSTAGNLKNHVRTHTGERPYVCSFEGCSKRFAEHSSLRKHKITHTGSKPYACDICNKTFSQSGSRNTHRKRHLANSNCTSTNQNALQQNSEVSMTNQDHDMLEMRQGAEYVLHLTDVEFQQAADSQSHTMGSESVVLSQGVSDHVVTVTTQPVETENDQLELPQTMLESEEMGQEALPPASSPAAVVVMSQPQHTVTMSSQETTFHDPDTQQTTTVEIVYGNELLQSELDQNISHNIHVSNSMSHSINENGEAVEENTNKDMIDLGAMIETDSSHNNSDDDDHDGDLGGPLQLVCDGIDDEQFQ
ncbi:zinc finger protein 143-like [Ptychodera flava]|uniref:zinc finger protein 143-like n=1 Tax=Ptychodera flava TaxID=63121 RepID=UPI00396AA9B2